MFAGCAPLVAAVSLVAGADLDRDLHSMPTRYFALPIHLSAERRARIDHILLYVSIDRGKTWLRVDRVSPDAERFTFLAPEDGIYWFVQQTVAADDRKEPAKIDADTPGIVKVLVQAHGTALYTNFNGSDAEIRARIEQVEKRILEVEKRIEDMELRARVKRLERALAEMQKRQTAAR